MADSVSDLYTVAPGGALVRRQRMPAPHLAIDAHLCMPWVEVNVRTLTLDQPLDAVFQPSMCYLDQCLGERARVDTAAYVGEGLSMPFAPIGDSVLVPAGHTFHVRCGAMDRRVLCCMIDSARLDALRDWDWNDATLAQCRDLRIPALREALLQLARETLAPGFAAETLAESLVLAALVQIARHFHPVAATSESSGTRLAAWQLRLIRERVEASIGPSPGIVELAAACRFSARHLARTFKNSTGITLGAFVADARIRQAKALLTQRDVMVKAVAYECGFQSPAAFASAFRKITGRTPREYRRDAHGLLPAADGDAADASEMSVSR